MYIIRERYFYFYRSKIKRSTLVFIGRRKHKAFLDLLLEASEIDEHPLSTDEIREQVDTFMFAVIY